jgi:hypothetical protein
LRQRSTAFWGSGPGDIYVVGGTPAHTDVDILHSTGTGTWVSQGNDYGLSSIWASGSTDVYIAAGSAIIHSAGSGVWTAETSSSPSVTNVWGSASSDVYAVGPYGIILHR